MAETRASLMPESGGALMAAGPGIEHNRVVEMAVRTGAGRRPPPGTVPHKGKIMVAFDAAQPARESHEGADAPAWSRVETWLLALVIALVALAVTIGPALAHAGR